MVINRPGGGMSLSGNMVCRPIKSVDSADLQRVYYYTIFPNLLLSLHAEYVMVHRLQPVAPDRTKLVCDWLFEPEALETARIDDAVEFWDITNREDWHACEITQQGVSSRRYTPGPYAHNEGMLYAFDQHYLSAMRE
jgi:Rieske 2Fe-2S family protein